MSGEKSPQDIWEETVRRVKEMELVPLLWKALDVSKALALEGDTLIVGIAPVDYHLAGHLEAHKNKLLIERALSEVLGRRATIRVIQGTKPEDWERLKQREEVTRAMMEARAEARRREMDLERFWRDVGDEIHRKFMSTPHRHFPQVRAKFLLEVAVPMLLEAEPRAREMAPSEEVAERQLARAIDRVAELLGVPSSVLALEALRRGLKG
ncbi:MAG TPA: hypothetical protein EYP65_01440 [Armatimonadetes bacterium]|nr:hypothetical protein [Armatimonadota bacterium]